MDPSKIYDYLALARQQLLDAARSLSAEQYTREFPIGLGSLRATFTHMIMSEWYYIMRMRQREVPPYETWSIHPDRPPSLDALEPLWAEQAEQTRAAITEVPNWNAPIEYRVTDDDGVPMIVTASPADLFTQLLTHEVHHRAQALNILRHLGITLGDLDFNAMMYDRRRA